MSALRCLVLWFLLLSVAPASHAQDVPAFIRHYSEALRSGALSALEGEPVAAAAHLPTFYAQREFAPAWDDGTDGRGRYRELLDALQDAASHGLDPADYHVVILNRLAATHDPREQAVRDMLATDALVRYSRHLRTGKVDPVRLDPDWNLERRVADDDPLRPVERALAAPSLADFINRELAPSDPLYDGLRSALAGYRDLARSGGWPPVSPGATLRLGDRGPRITALRNRLVITDAILRSDATDPALFNPALEDAVKRFQLHHGLAVDGLVGRRTLAALNVPAAARIDQLRVNLERTRWVFPNREPRYVIVNIAGFRAYLVENGETVWDARVQVGKPYRRTPVFKARMTYLVLNPSWTVPPTILKNDVIPRLILNPDYLHDNDMVLLDRQGNLVAMDRATLQQVNARNFPYVVRQQPGPNNPLGRIKFMFPNAHSVYLHDTPSQTLFERADRTFSSGCIRIERPLELAERLLADPAGWNRSKLEERIATGDQQSVTLKQSVPVFVMYWTAEPDADGEITFYNDIYERDEAVLEALDEPARRAMKADARR